MVGKAFVVTKYRGHQYLTAAEVAKMLRIHPITVYRQVAAQKLHPLRIGRIWRFDPGEVETLMQASDRPAPRNGRRKRP